MIRRWWRTSVQFRLVSFFLLLSWSSVVTVGTLAFVRARQELSGSALTRLEAAAALKGDELRRWIDGQRRDLLVLAAWPDLQRTAAAALRAYTPTDARCPRRRPRRCRPRTVRRLAGSLATVSPACAKARTLFDAVLAQKPDLREIFILTSIGGRIVCSSNPAHIGESRALDAYSVKGREQTFVQTVYPSPVTGRPLVSLATPLLEAGTDRALGVLGAHLNLDEMDRIMRAPSGLGEGSEIYLVDRYNVFISAARFGRPRYPRGIHSMGIDAAVSGDTGKGSYANYDGAAVLGAWRWIDELGVAIVAEMPRTAALAPSRRLAWTILTAGFISAGALAIGVLFLARRITSPLLAINRAARGVAAGDLTQHAPVATDDEVGVLAQSFNDMTDQLRGLYGELADSAARFAKVFDASPMAIAITTFEEGRYVDVNPRWLQLIGRERDEVIGHTAKELGVWADPEDRDIVIADLREHAIALRPRNPPADEIGRSAGVRHVARAHHAGGHALPDQPVQRRHRSEAHRARAAGEPGSAPAGAEARSDRPSRRRHRARFQQPADDHHRLQRHADEPSAGRRRRTRRTRGDPQGGPAGRVAHAAAPRVQPEAGAGAARARPQRGDRQPRSHAAAARGRTHHARDAPRRVPRIGAGRSGADRTGDRQPGRQRARRDARPAAR